MSISVFDLFSIGIGPSSSHTVGPMKAAHQFIEKLAQKKQLMQITKIKVELYGSLALTGKGHGTAPAILNGLEGQLPKSVDPQAVVPRMEKILQEKKIFLANQHLIPFNFQEDFIFHKDALLPKHTNGMRFSAYDEKENTVFSIVYYSIGGGFIVTETEFDQEHNSVTLPYPFKHASELWAYCKAEHLSIAGIMLANELVWRTEDEIRRNLLEIAAIMDECVEQGCQTEGTLPGGLNVKRRAAELYKKLCQRGIPQPAEYPDALLFPTVYAMAVNEENAAGGRIVTAPTNGAAGIIPAVLTYYRRFHLGANDEGVIQFLLTAGAIAILYKKGASISGAEVGCQGEVGVACSMAAGALTAVLGGTLAQIENAAEMAMEHHLGMTCDPVAGLVQIPCIERNGVAAEKAIKLCYLALMEDGSDKKVSLDDVIDTMRETGKNMSHIYKETSLGGLAAKLGLGSNIPEC